MSVLPATNRVTPDELLQMPDNNSLELYDGQIVEQTVSKESVRIAMRIGALLLHEADRSGGFEVYGSDLGYQCFPFAPTDVRKPDASVIKKDRLSSLPPDPGYMPIPADLAVEVVSPNDLARKVETKVKEYLDAGFGLVWVVHPETRSVLIRRGDGSVAIVGENDEISGESAMPTFRCKVAEFFK